MVVLVVDLSLRDEVFAGEQNARHLNHHRRLPRLLLRPRLHPRKVFAVFVVSWLPAEM